MLTEVDGGGSHVVLVPGEESSQAAHEHFLGRL
jgi:hypothetical protein